MAKVPQEQTFDPSQMKGRHCPESGRRAILKNKVRWSLINIRKLGIEPFDLTELALSDFEILLGGFPGHDRYIEQ